MLLINMAMKTRKKAVMHLLMLCPTSYTPPMQVDDGHYMEIRLKRVPL